MYTRAYTLARHRRGGRQVYRNRSSSYPQLPGNAGRDRPGGGGTKGKTSRKVSNAKAIRAVAYLRVSTVGQVEDGHGLEIQEERGRQWAKSHGHSILGFYADEGISGKIDTRAGLEEALSAVRFNSAEGIVVASLDRLARSLTVQEAALQQVWSAGGRVFSIDTGEVMADDPDDPD